MAQSQVKTYRRNGKLVRGHSRKRKILRNIAIGAAGLGVLGGGIAVARNPAGVKALGKRVFRRLPPNLQGGIRKVAKQRRLQQTVRRLGPDGVAKVQAEANAFDAIVRSETQKIFQQGGTNQQVRQVTLNGWKKISPEGKELILGSLEQNNPAGYRKLRSDLLQALRDDGPVRQREDAFNKVRAYAKHFQKGGDRAGETMNPKQYQKLLKKAREQGGGRSAAETRAYIRQTLGFSRGNDLTRFNHPTRRWIRHHGPSIHHL